MQLIGLIFLVAIVKSSTDLPKKQQTLNVPKTRDIGRKDQPSLLYSLFRKIGTISFEVFKLYCAISFFVYFMAKPLTWPIHSLTSRKYKKK